MVTRQCKIKGVERGRLGIEIDTRERMSENDGKERGMEKTRELGVEMMARKSSCCKNVFS